MVRVGRVCKEETMERGAMFVRAASDAPRRLARMGRAKPDTGKGCLFHQDVYIIFISFVYEFNTDLPC